MRLPLSAVQYDRRPTPYFLSPNEQNRQPVSRAAPMNLFQARRAVYSATVPCLPSSFSTDSLLVPPTSGAAAWNEGPRPTSIFSFFFYGALVRPLLSHAETFLFFVFYRDEVRPLALTTSVLSGCSPRLSETVFDFSSTGAETFQFSVSAYPEEVYSESLPH